MGLTYNVNPTTSVKRIPKKKKIEETHNKDFKNPNFPVVESSYNVKGTTLTQNDQKGCQASKKT